MSPQQSTVGSSEFSFAQPVVENRWRIRQLLFGTQEAISEELPASPVDVLHTWPMRIGIEVEQDGSPGLRRPQYGAVHSLLGYWTTDPRLPATIVMPTGTGKTDTMVAAMMAQRTERLLVLVPSDALRDQLADKFEELGVLPLLKIVDETVMRPVVGRLSGGLVDAADALKLAQSCNVVIATPNALNHTSDDARSAFLSSFTHLFIDEAHHVAAPTWQRIRDEFGPRPVVQFTATPHRRDGQHLGGTLVYVFPLREAQREGYFSTIRYKSVLSLLDPDGEIAKTALEFLREDIEKNFDHILMARVRNVGRAEDVLIIYLALAPELNPVLIHSKLPRKDQQTRLNRIKSRESRILVCIDMFGEGFDLPQLKIAALHDPHRSLGITLQFVGRFARGGVDGLGTATVISARSEVRHDESLRRLYAEDADWNLIIEDLSTSAVDQQQEIDEFTKSFNSLPDQVSIHSLTPAMSTVVFRPTAVAWHPERILEAIGRANLVTSPVPVNTRDGVAWFVTRSSTSPRWGDVDDIDSVEYHLYVIYWDAVRGLLYINSSNNDSVHEKLAQAVMGESGLEPLRGESIYRVFDGVQRLTPNNIGLLDARNRNRRYTSYVGTDVTDALPASQKQTKAQTHISGTGFLDGARFTIAGSLKGRIWSHRTANGLKPWTDWCDIVGPKIVDASISVDDIMAGFIRPLDIEEWPDLHVLGVELPAEVTELLQDSNFEIKAKSVPFHELEFRVLTQPQGSELGFIVETADWSSEYRLALGKSGLLVKPVKPTGDVQVRRAKSDVPLSRILTKYGIRVILEADSVVEPPGVLLRPNRELEPYDPARLHILDWVGVNMRRESWGSTRDDTTVQGFVMKQVMSEEWDVIIDDDGNGEVADVVCLRVVEGALLVRFIHCKFSHEDKPGARLEDLYEVVGQAQRSAAWRRDLDGMFIRLIRRERTRAGRGVTGFVRGDIAVLHDMLEVSPTLAPVLQIAIAQPGLSASKVDTRHLELLASADTYLSDVALTQLEVMCSP